MTEQTTPNQEISDQDLAKIQQANDAIALAIKAGLELYLTQNGVGLTKLLMKALEDQKFDYSNYGQDKLLEFVSQGKQVFCNSTLINMTKYRLVLQSYMRIEEMPANLPTQH